MINLNKVNNLVSTCVNYVENKYVELTTYARLPYKEFSQQDALDFENAKKISANDILNAYRENFLQSFISRMDACASMLIRNIYNVVYNNGKQILFKKNNGRYHTFNESSFQAMDQGRKIFSNKSVCVEQINTAMLDQLIKDLIYQGVKEWGEKDGICPGDIASYLVEMFGGNMYHKGAEDKAAEMQYLIDLAKADAKYFQEECERLKANK